MSIAQTPSAGSRPQLIARLTPALYLRLEGLAMLALTVAAYRSLQLHTAGALGWTVFTLGFFLPDVAMVGYLRGPAVGALLYNLAHTELLPVAMLALAYVSGQAPLASVGLLWLAHIGFDRAAGYGLKRASAFGDTHLGPIGRSRAL